MIHYKVPEILLVSLFVSKASLLVNLNLLPTLPQMLDGPGIKQYPAHIMLVGWKLINMTKNIIDLYNK
jgi:hypothetical protein